MAAVVKPYLPFERVAERPRHPHLPSLSNASYLPDALVNSEKQRDLEMQVLALKIREKNLQWCIGKKFLAMEHNFIAAK